ncbi:SdrD B-like domain-containing protein, partial [Listeria monocytogenes]
TDGIIIGKVYADLNRDGIQQKAQNELGVAGVRLYLEDGTFVVTDSEGKYSVYGMKAKTHVIKLDRTTLPRGVELVEQSNRNAGDPGSRFVDLKFGELHRADFAITDGIDSNDNQGHAALISDLQKRAKQIAIK